MFRIGCHLSVSNGYAAMGETILRYGGNTFAWFTRNPRGGKTREPEAADVAALRAHLEQGRIGPLVAHGSYTMNLCSADETTRANALDMLRRDLAVMEKLPGQYYNFHPGAHTGQGKAAGIAQIVAGLNACVTPETRTTVLLETMPGKGTEIGSTFEELADILGELSCPDRAGVCFDTCHVWDAGYDLVGDLDGVLTRFDRAVGLDRLRAVHFNDSLSGRGTRRDRHARLGEGRIGLEALRRIALHPALYGKPFILETPNDEAGYLREIRMVLEWAEEIFPERE